eukprot:9341533-Pyramimonas_sp.AAC.1
MTGRDAFTRESVRACDAIAQFTDEQHVRIMDRGEFHDHIHIVHERALALELREHEQSPEYQFDDDPA